MDAFDPRLVQVGFDLGDETVTFNDLAVYITGTKFGSASMNQCQVRIYNLTREQRNYILTKASPYVFGQSGSQTVNMTVDVGRESYGTFRLFEGKVFTTDMTQPPDIGITIDALTNSYMLGVALGGNQSGIAQLSIICQQVAANNQLTLDFQATDKQIDNYSFSGVAAKEIDLLNEVGGIQAFVNNKTLLVVDNDKAKKGEPRLISKETGMVGIPQVTQQGVLVKMMIDNTIDLASAVTIKSEMNPAANGTYKVIAINFEIANRDQPFWYILTCSGSPIYASAQ